MVQKMIDVIRALFDKYDVNRSNFISKDEVSIKNNFNLGCIITSRYICIIEYQIQSNRRRFKVLDENE